MILVCSAHVAPSSKACGDIYTSDCSAFVGHPDSIMSYESYTSCFSSNIINNPPHSPMPL
eukprot:scaffold90183_cov22-Cyclotella_meneghiniana.AAC.1